MYTVAMPIVGKIHIEHTLNFLGKYSVSLRFHSKKIFSSGGANNPSGQPYKHIKQ